MERQEERQEELEKQQRQQALTEQHGPTESHEDQQVHGAEISSEQPQVMMADAVLNGVSGLTTGAKQQKVIISKCPCGCEGRQMVHCSVCHQATVACIMCGRRLSTCCCDGKAEANGPRQEEVSSMRSSPHSEKREEHSNGSVFKSGTLDRRLKATSRAVQGLLRQQFDQFGCCKPVEISEPSDPDTMKAALYQTYKNERILALEDKLAAVTAKNAEMSHALNGYTHGNERAAQRRLVPPLADAPAVVSGTQQLKVPLYVPGGNVPRNVLRNIPLRSQQKVNQNQSPYAESLASTAQMNERKPRYEQELSRVTSALADIVKTFKTTTPTVSAHKEVRFSDQRPKEPFESEHLRYLQKQLEISTQKNSELTRSLQEIRDNLAEVKQRGKPEDRSRERVRSEVKELDKVSNADISAEGRHWINRLGLRGPLRGYDSDDKEVTEETVSTADSLLKRAKRKFGYNFGI